MIEAIDLEKLRFPIGKFNRPESYSKEQLKNWINTIASFPNVIEETVMGLNTEQLNWKYRPDGWNIQQLVHHCADSHMNGIIRTKLALTEDCPTIKPYPEHLWAELRDTISLDISFALQTIKGVHQRWSMLLDDLSPEQLKREYYHPEDDTNYSIQEQCALYAWHCDHHMAHIKQALEAEGKYN